MVDEAHRPDRPEGAGGGRRDERAGAAAAGAQLGLLDRIDGFQQRHNVIALPWAVFRKFSEDQAGNLAALIAYWAFFSIFPLLLAATTILGYVLGGDPALEHMVFSSALGQFPIIGQHDATKPLTGNPAGLVIGLGLAIWSGTSVATQGQQAFNTIYGVPRSQWPGFPQWLLRSLELLVVAGLGLVVTTLLQGVVSGAGTYGLHLGIGAVIAGAIIGIALNAVLFVYLFCRLTVHELKWRDVIAGAVVAAIAWFLLQKVGTGLVNRKVAGAQGTYGTFAVVIGLLFWFYLLAQITMYCGELNVVLARRLWPRSLRSYLFALSVTEADREAYRAYPQLERQVHNMNVHVEVGEQHDDDRDDSGADGSRPD